jgi:hypothetical protein
MRLVPNPDGLGARPSVLQNLAIAGAELSGRQRHDPIETAGEGLTGVCSL